MSEPAALDPERIRQLRDLEAAIGREILGEVIDAFLADLPRRLDKLRTAVAQGDAGGIGDVAHSLKGSCGNVGAYRARQLSIRLEDSVRDSASEEATRLLPLLEHELGRVGEALAAERERGLTSPVRETPPPRDTADA